MDLKKYNAEMALVRLSGTQLYRLENCQNYGWPVISAARELRYARLVCRAAADFADRQRAGTSSAKEKAALCTAIQAFKDCMAFEERAAND